MRDRERSLARDMRRPPIRPQSAGGRSSNSQERRTGGLHVRRDLRTRLASKRLRRAASHPIASRLHGSTHMVDQLRSCSHQLVARPDHLQVHLRLGPPVPDRMQQLHVRPALPCQELRIRPVVALLRRRRPYTSLGFETTTSCPSRSSWRDTHGECVDASSTTRHRGRPPKYWSSPPGVVARMACLTTAPAHRPRTPGSSYRPGPVPPLPSGTAQHRFVSADLRLRGSRAR